MGRQPKKAVSRFGNVRQLPNGRWEARYTYKGTGESKTFDQAKNGWSWLAKTQVAIDEGRHVDVRGRKRPFNDVVDDWLRDIRHMDKGTFYDYSSIIELHGACHFKDRPIGEITHADVQAWVNYQLDMEQAAVTVRKRKTVLSLLFKFAVISGLRFDNPCQYVRVPSDETLEVLPLTLPEVMALAKNMREPYDLAILLGAFSGLRAGEIWDAKVSSLQPLRGQMAVVSTVREVTGHGMVSRPCPKNGQWRSANVPADLMARLVSHVDGKAPTDLIFTAPDGGQVRHNNFYDRMWLPAIEASGIERAPRFHDLRHTCASLYFGHGSSGEEVQRVLGHTSITTTRKYYIHLYPDAFDKAITGIDDAIRDAEANFEIAQAGANGGAQWDARGMKLRLVRGGK